MHHLWKKKHRKSAILCAFIVACLSFLSAPVWGDDEAVAVRKIFGQWQDAVITVQITIEQRMVVSGRQMNKSEQKIEVGATIIDPSGLAVVSLASTDPAGILAGLMRHGEEDGLEFDWKSEIKNIKMILADGHEVPVKIVLRDKDLDLAFIHPTEKLPGSVLSLDLSRYATPEISDQIVVLHRLGKAVSRIAAVSLSRVRAVVKKPRTIYIPDIASMNGELGSPVFSLDGKVVGILLLGIKKTQNASIGIDSMFSGMGGMGIIPGVLPAEAIMGVAAQALKIVHETKSEEGKQDEVVK